MKHVSHLAAQIHHAGVWVVEWKYHTVACVDLLDRDVVEVLWREEKVYSIQFI